MATKKPVTTGFGVAMFMLFIATGAYGTGKSICVMLTIWKIENLNANGNFLG